MGFRCLLGHDFGEAEIERKRQEDGEQVIVTVREVKRCQRCDDRLVLSENKEVTSVAQLAEAAEGTVDPSDPDTAAESEETADPDFEPVSTDATDPVSIPDAELEPDTQVESPAGSPSAGSATADASTDDAVILDDADTEPSPETTTDADSTVAADLTADAEPSDPVDGAELLGDEQGDATGAGPDSALSSRAADGTDSELDADSDNGVILDDTPQPEQANRDRGEWPENDERDGPSQEHTPWPEHSGKDEGYSAGSEDDQSSISFDSAIEADPTPSPDAAGATKRQAQSATQTAEPTVSTEGGSGDGTEVTEAGFVRFNSSDTDGESTGATPEYLCPDCGHVELVKNSSMRAGDICPECRRGYITERRA
jgi:hypothetical protein